MSIVRLCVADDTYAARRFDPAVALTLGTTIFNAADVGVLEPVSDLLVDGTVCPADPPPHADNPMTRNTPSARFTAACSAYKVAFTAQRRECDAPGTHYDGGD
jgi:hypothetical protein